MRHPLPASSVAAGHPDYSDLSFVASVISERACGASALTSALGALLRSSIDVVIDTPKTSRRSYDELEKTEKTYLGTRVEIQLRALLKLPKGRLDLRVDNHDVDIKFTVGNNWMIPSEAIDAICVLVAADEENARCYLGLIKARPGYLTSGANRDGKKSVAASGFSNILWLVGGKPYAANFWRSVDPTQIEKIFSPSSGTKRIVALFSELRGRPIARSVVADVAQQLDYMKRVRSNGGARDALAAAGIVLLSGQYDRALIAALGLPQCNADEFVSMQLSDPTQQALAAAHGHVVTWA